MAMQILRLPRVIQALGIGRTTLYTDIAGGLFPRPVKLGARSVGWPESEVDAIVAAKIAGKSDSDIRALVRELEAARLGVAA